MRPVALTASSPAARPSASGHWRRRDRQPPFVVAPAGGQERPHPHRPPRRRPSRDRLHHQHLRPRRGRVDQPLEEIAAEVVGELVGDVAEQDRRRRPGLGAAASLTAPGAIGRRSAPGGAVEAEGAISGSGFVDGPGVDVEPGDRRAVTGPAHPRGAGRPRAAAQIGEPHRLRSGQRGHDVRGRQEAPGGVVERIGGALAGGVERAPAAQPSPALHVGGGERPQRPRHLGRRHVAQVAGFEVGDPAVEPGGAVGGHRAARNAATRIGRGRWAVTGDR